MKTKRRDNNATHNSLTVCASSAAAAAADDTYIKRARALCIEYIQYIIYIRNTNADKTYSMCQSTGADNKYEFETYTQHKYFGQACRQRRVGVNITRTYNNIETKLSCEQKTPPPPLSNVSRRFLMIYFIRKPTIRCTFKVEQYKS